MKNFFKLAAVVVVTLAFLSPVIWLVWALIDNGSKHAETANRMAVIASTWDGSKETPDVANEKDAWGEPIFAEVSTGPINNQLKLWCSHRVIVRVKKPHGISYVNKGIEASSEAAAKGMTRGAIQGIKEGLKK